MKKFDEWLADRDPDYFEETKKWIAGAIKHPGRCKNPGDEKCPKGSRQYNLAMRFKHGDIHQDNLNKGKKKN